jgi:hypothetical protein
MFWGVYEFLKDSLIRTKVLILVESQSVLRTTAVYR